MEGKLSMNDVLITGLTFVLAPDTRPLLPPPPAGHGKMLLFCLCV